MPRSEAKARADAKWEKKAYDKILLRIRKDADMNRDFFQEYAASKGESLNGFFLRAAKEAIERDKNDKS